LPSGEAAILAEARSLIDWHARHRFCAQCGSQTRVESAGWVRRCPECRASHFPRTDPVVIMLSVRGEYGLLGRNRRRAGNRFSCLAGFMEPGETLEEAVRREVLEESGVRLDAVAYIASQPWPFPSSLMLGFDAVAERVDPSPGDDELAEVRWFERDEVERAARGEGDLVLSPPYSIARRLIDTWLADGRR